MRRFLSLAILCLISACGGGGKGAAPIDLSTPAPTVTLSADPASVLLETDTILSWSSMNADACSANWTSSTSTSGSETVTLTAAGNNSYSISCNGAGGNTSNSIVISAYLSSECLQNGGAVSDYNALRNAINNSSGDGQDNIIYLHDGSYIFSEVIFYDAKGTLENLTLKGCSGTNSEVIFDGQNISRIFEFQKNGPLTVETDERDAQPPFPSVNINDIEFKNAIIDNTIIADQCYGICGSVILANRFHLTLNNTLFKNNNGTIQGTIVDGIVNLEINDSIFQDNSASSILSFSGDLEMSNTSFLDNQGRALHAGIAAYVNCHKRVIRNSLFDSNDTAFNSLEWDCDDDDISNIQLEIDNTRFINNKSGLILRGTNVNIFNSLFEGNYEGYGNETEGFCDNNYDGEFDGTQITGHDTNCLTGGAIMSDKWDLKWGVLTIENTDFINNQARDFGGAIDMLGSVRCDDSDYFRYADGCEDSNSPIDEIDLIIRNSNFFGNKSHRGAAISIAKRGPQGGNIRIENSVFEGNKGIRPEEYIQTIEDLETSIIVSGGDADIYNTVFSNNEAEEEVQVKGVLQCDNSC